MDCKITTFCANNVILTYFYYFVTNSQNVTKNPLFFVGTKEEGTGATW